MITPITRSTPLLALACALLLGSFSPVYTAPAFKNTSALAKALSTECASFQGDATETVKILDQICEISTYLKALSAQLDQTYATKKDVESAMIMRIKKLILQAPMSSDEKKAEELMNTLESLKSDLPTFEKATNVLENFFKYIGALGVCCYVYSQQPGVDKHDVLTKVMETKKIVTFNDLLAIS